MPVRRGCASNNRPLFCAVRCEVSRLNIALAFTSPITHSARCGVFIPNLTRQNDITPRQFGVLLTLHQRGTLTLTELANHIRVDRSTLGEMINRMARRSLVTKRHNGKDGRSAEVLLAPTGKAVLFEIVRGAARLQTALLAPLAAEDRAHFMRWPDFNLLVKEGCTGIE